MLKPISNKKELTFLKPADFLSKEFNEYTFQSETTKTAKQVPSSLKCFTYFEEVIHENKSI